MLVKARELGMQFIDSGYIYSNDLIFTWKKWKWKSQAVQNSKEDKENKLCFSFYALGFYRSISL